MAVKNTSQKQTFESESWVSLNIKSEQTCTIFLTKSPVWKLFVVKIPRTNISTDVKTAYVDNLKYNMNLNRTSRI